VPFSCAARPPLLAISRCFSADIDANPRRSLRSPVVTAQPSVSVTYRVLERHTGPSGPVAEGGPGRAGDAARRAASPEPRPIYRARQDPRETVLPRIPARRRSSGLPSHRTSIKLCAHGRDGPWGVNSLSFRGFGGDRPKTGSPAVAAVCYRRAGYSSE
jgi:hypothetical protein